MVLVEAPAAPTAVAAPVSAPRTPGAHAYGSPRELARGASKGLPTNSAVPHLGATPAASPPPLPSASSFEVPDLAINDLPPSPAEMLATEPVSLWQSMVTYGREWRMFAAGAMVGVLLGMTVWVVVSRALRSGAPAEAAVAEAPASGEQTTPPSDEPPAEESKPVEQEQQVAKVVIAEETPTPAPQAVEALKPVMDDPVEQPLPEAIEPARAIPDSEPVVQAPASEPTLAPPAEQPPVADMEPEDVEPADAPQIDSQVAARLAVRIPKLAFQQIPLRQFLGFLTDLTGVRMVVDTASLQAAGKKPPLVTVRADEATVEQLLQTLATDHGLTWTEEAGTIVLRAR